MKILATTNHPSPWPTVPARLSACGTLLIIDRCPYCRHRHEHGAGGGYGHRWAHCLREAGEPVQGYILVEGAGEAAATVINFRRRRKTWPKI